jgi:hypothetical protein
MPSTWIRAPIAPEADRNAAPTISGPRPRARLGAARHKRFWSFRAQVRRV